MAIQQSRWRLQAAASLLLTCALAPLGGAGEKPKGPKRLKDLDPFYTQHAVADGLLIVSSDKVSKYARAEAAYLVKKLLVHRPDVLKRLVDKGAYIGVMAHNEMTRALPEFRKMSPWWDKRARGLGGNPVTCGEENLLAFKGDPYRGENIFIHEFAHALHGAFVDVEPALKARLKALFEKTKATERFSGYGMGSFGEFWAEGVQSWFNCNRGGGFAALGPDGKPICQVNDREQMKTHMSALAALLDETFRKNEWVYAPVAQRLDEPHLKGYNPSTAPTFRWPPEVTEAFKRIEAEKARKRKQKR